MSSLDITVPAGLSHQHALWTDMTPEAMIAVVGPYGCGKTLGLFIKAMLLSAANCDPRVDGLLVVPTYPMARIVHIPEWQEFARQMGFTLHWRGGDGCFVWPWGSRTWLRSADEPNRLAGPNLAYVEFDEPGLMDVVAWERAVARVRHPKAKIRQTVLGGTPEGLNWFADEFAEPKPPRRTIYANEWHPDLAGYADKLMELYSYDPSLQDSYVGGKFVPLRVGRAYRFFDRSVHVRKTQPMLGMQWAIGCDFNVDTMRWVVAQVSNRSIIVHDVIELGASGSTEEACRVVAARWGYAIQGSLIVTGDAAGQARSTSGKADYIVIREELGKVLGDMRISVPAANPRVIDRVANLNYTIAGRKGRTFVVDPRATDLILDLERVTWSKNGLDLDKKDPKRTHASDALGYLAWQLARAAAGDRRTHIKLVRSESNEHPATATW